MKKSQLKKMIKESIKNNSDRKRIKKKIELLKLANESVDRMYEIGFREYGIPIPTLKQRKEERKRLWEDIRNSEEYKQSIDRMQLLQEIKNIASGNF